MSLCRASIVVALVALVTGGSLVAAEKTAESSAKIGFRKTQLDEKFRSEGVAVGDFNGDGKRDIAANDFYYAAPDWRPVPIVEQPREYDPHKYSNSFCNWAEDLNGDGRTDLIVVDFPGKETWWLENPGTDGRPWARHVLTPVTNNESPLYEDVDGDGRRELIAGYSPDAAEPDGPKRRMGIFHRAADPLAPWSIQAVSAENTEGTRKYYHGLGAGDINGDGRRDIVIPHGWWEQPADKQAENWTFHEAKLGAPCAQMHVFDIDGDGDSDVLSSAAHQLGIWWHEQTPDGWQTHEIDKTFSQTHALATVDLNGDGLLDFVTGKRWWAHGPKGDVNPEAPAVMYWFELQREGGQPRWIPHQFDEDGSGVGTQFEVADVNGDGLLDVATSNKHGVFYFEQTRE